MKFNKIAMAVLAASAVPLAAQAGVTVTPLVGYHYTDRAADDQRTFCALVRIYMLMPIIIIT